MIKEITKFRKDLLQEICNSLVAVYRKKSFVLYNEQMRETCFKLFCEKSQIEKQFLDKYYDDNYDMVVNFAIDVFRVTVNPAYFFKYYISPEIIGCISAENKEVMCSIMSDNNIPEDIISEVVEYNEENIVDDNKKLSPEQVKSILTSTPEWEDFKAASEEAALNDEMANMFVDDMMRALPFFVDELIESIDKDAEENAKCISYLNKTTSILYKKHSALFKNAGCINKSEISNRSDWFSGLVLIDNTATFSGDDVVNLLDFLTEETKEWEMYQTVREDGTFGKTKIEFTYEDLVKRKKVQE